MFDIRLMLQVAFLAFAFVNAVPPRLLFGRLGRPRKGSGGTGPALLKDMTRE